MKTMCHLLMEYLEEIIIGDRAYHTQREKSNYSEWFGGFLSIQG